MKITSFYLVLKPSEKFKELEDCFSEVDLNDLQLLFLGGLKQEEIHGLYSMRLEALEIATDLLNSRTLCPHCGKIMS